MAIDDFKMVCKVQMIKIELQLIYPTDVTANITDAGAGLNVSTTSYSERTYLYY